MKQSEKQSVRKEKKKQQASSLDARVKKIKCHNYHSRSYFQPNAVISNACYT